MVVKELIHDDVFTAITQHLFCTWGLLANVSPMQFEKNWLAQAGPAKA